MMRKVFSLAFATFFLLAMFCVGVLAQQETGQITGKVVDPNGAVVPGATVCINRC